MHSVSKAWILFFRASKQRVGTGQQVFGDKLMLNKSKNISEVQYSTYLDLHVFSLVFCFVFVFVMHLMHASFFFFFKVERDSWNLMASCMHAGYRGSRN